VEDARRGIGVDEHRARVGTVAEADAHRRLTRATAPASPARAPRAASRRRD
jgi:hypothetical protein